MTKTNNPEEINIDSENESEGEAPQGMTSFLALFPFRSGDQVRATGKYFAEVDIQKQPVPDQVFGSLAKEDD